MGVQRTKKPPGWRLRCGVHSNATTGRDTELFTDDGLDVVEVMLHENEFLRHVRDAFQEMIEGIAVQNGAGKPYPPGPIDTVPA